MIPIGGFQPLTLSDFPGTPAALVFVRGCTMRCPYCHNRRLWDDDGPTLAAQEVLARIATRRHLLGGVVVSGGEPTMHAGLPAFLAAIRAQGLRVKLDTNGSRPQILAAILAAGLVDHVALDMKAPWSNHDRITGSTGLAGAVAESLDLLRDAGVPYELRTTVCGGLHDADSLTAILDGLRPGECWFLQAYVMSMNAEAPPDPTISIPTKTMLDDIGRQARLVHINCLLR